VIIFYIKSTCFYDSWRAPNWPHDKTAKIITGEISIAASDALNRPPEPKFIWYKSWFLCWKKCTFRPKSLRLRHRKKRWS